MKFTAKRIAALAVLTALSLITFMIESLLPPLIVPGAKIGLANVFTLCCLFTLGAPSALTLVIARTLLGSLLTGNLYSLLYSMGGGLAALLLTTLLWLLCYPRVSIIAISVAGAVIHNVTQNLIFVLVAKTPLMVAYTPYLALIGVLSGIIVGVAVYLAVKALPQRLLSAISE